MATSVISARPLWINAYDFSSSVHGLAIDYGADEKDGTTLADSTHIAKGGIKTFGFGMEGHWDETSSNPVDSQQFSKTGANSVMTYATGSGAEGEAAYFINLLQSAYEQSGGVGEMFAFTVSGNAAGNLIRGTIELKGSLTSTGNSTGRQLGAVVAGQSVYAAMHVTTVSGTSPTFDAIVQSDDNGSFPSATNRLTFTQATSITSEILSTAGAITDDFWRVNYTIGGTDTPTFIVVVTIGIL